MKIQIYQFFSNDFLFYLPNFFLFICHVLTCRYLYHLFVFHISQFHFSFDTNEQFWLNPTNRIHKRNWICQCLYHLKKEKSQLLGLQKEIYFRFRIKFDLMSASVSPIHKRRRQRNRNKWIKITFSCSHVPHHCSIQKEKELIKFIQY